MKKILMLVAALSLAAVPGFSQRFAFKLSGGLDYASGGDLAAGIQGQSDYLNTEYGTTGEYKIPRLGLNFAGEIIFFLRPHLGIGIGAGYLHHVQESQITYDVSDIAATETIKPTISVVPITLNIHFLVPVSSKVTLDLSAGPGYYFATFKWDYRMDLSLLGYSGYDAYAFKANKGGLGFQGGVGLEFAFSPRLALVVSILGRYASIDKFQGSWTDKGGGDFWEFDDSGNDHSAWYYEWQVGGKSYGQLAFQSGQPSGTTVGNPRPAKLGLTGFVAAIGFKIGLGRS
jgi:hypothetical protein